MSQSDSDAVTQIREQIDADTISRAEDIDGVDVNTIIQNVADKRSSYGVDTQARFASAELDRQIDAADSETVKGILMGCRDRFNKNWPRRYSLVRSNGDHMEISSWEGELPGPDGNDVQLAPRTIVSLGCDYTEEYDDWQAKRVESSTGVAYEDLVGKLSKVAVSPSDIGRADEYEIVVVSGEIAFVNPQTLFDGDGEPQGEGNVLMEDKREPPQRHPHLELALSDDDNTRVRAHLERQRYGDPYVELPEIGMLLEDALEAGAPESQASFLQAALEGLEVVVVGNVNKVDTSRDDDGNQRTYVDIACSGVVANTATEETADATSESTDDSETDAPAPDAGTDVDDIVDSIETAAHLQGADVSELTQDDIESMAPAVVEENTDEEVAHALRVAKGETDESGGSGVDDPMELIREDGVYKCPADGCLYQAGSSGELLGHAQGEHGMDTDPETWVAERVGA